MKSNGCVSTDNSRKSQIASSSSTSPPHGQTHPTGLEDESLLDEDPHYFSVDGLDELDCLEEDQEEWEEDGDCELSTGESEDGDEGVHGAEEELLSDLEEDCSSEATSSEITDEHSFQTSGIGLEESFTQLSLLHSGGSTDLEQECDPLTTQYKTDTGLHHYRLSLARTAPPVASSDQYGVQVPPTATASIEGGGGVRGTELASPPLTPSLFPHLPPTIHFPLHNEKCEQYE